MAKSLEELLAEYHQTNAYKPMTLEQMQQQAANRFGSVYDQKRQSANQAYQTSDQALASQLSSLQGTYDKQRESTEKGFKQTYSMADRQALGRGMQRSSYNNATLANINLAEQEAQLDINEAQAAKAHAINEQRTLAAQQLAQQLALYDSSQKADELAYLDELTAREYERSQAAQDRATELVIAIYNAQRQKEQDELAQQNWLAEYELAKSKSSGGGSSGSRSSSSSSAPPTTEGQSSSYDAFIAALSGSPQKATTNSIVPLIANDAKVLNQNVYKQAAQKLQSGSGFQNTLAQKTAAKSEKLFPASKVLKKK